MLPLQEVHTDRPQPATYKSEIADLYERRSAAKQAAAGLGASPRPTALGNALAAGLAGMFGVRRTQP